MKIVIFATESFIIDRFIIEIFVVEAPGGTPGAFYKSSLHHPINIPFPSFFIFFSHVTI